MMVRTLQPPAERKAPVRSTIWHRIALKPLSSSPCATDSVHAQTTDCRVDADAVRPAFHQLYRVVTDTRRNRLPT
jgi:hypothetical protein